MRSTFSGSASNGGPPSGSDFFRCRLGRSHGFAPAATFGLSLRDSSNDFVSLPPSPRQIAGLRNQQGFNHEQLANLVSAAASVIEDIEEADYEGDFLSMASRIASALHRGVEVRFVPVEPSESTGITV